MTATASDWSHGDFLKEYYSRYCSPTGSLYPPPLQSSSTHLTSSLTSPITSNPKPRKQRHNSTQVRPDLKRHHPGSYQIPIMYQKNVLVREFTPPIMQDVMRVCHAKYRHENIIIADVPRVFPSILLSSDRHYALVLRHQQNSAVFTFCPKVFVFRMSP